jgi:hypothetical protein
MNKSLRPTIRRLGFLVGAFVGIVAIILLALLWSVTHALPPVRISYLCATNDPALPFAWGVFKLENDLNEPLTTGGGVFEKWDGHQWGRGVGTYFANFGGDREFGKGTTNNVQTALPKKEGRYRLALDYLPKSNLTPKFYMTGRYRFLQMLIRKGILSETTRSGRPIFPGYYMVEPLKAMRAYSQSIEVPAFR